MESAISTYISDFLDFLNASVEQLGISEEALARTNSELEDIQHYIEFGKADAVQQTKLYKLLKEARARRRTEKENIELCVPIAEWVKKNPDAVHSLQALLGSVRKVERNQMYRAYSVRTDILNGITEESHLTRRNNS